jgi:hypothetical protein
MKNITIPMALVLASVNLTGCAVVRGIFKAGVWSGALLVLVVVGMLAGAMMLFRNRA